MNRISARDLKRSARALLTGNHARLALATLLMAVFHLMLNYAVDYVFPTPGSILGFGLYTACSLLANMVYYILLAGLHRLYLNLCRGRAWSIGDLFSSFFYRPEPAAMYSVIPFALMNVLSNLALWTLLQSLLSFSITAVLILLAVSLLVIWLQLCLSMVLYLYCDAPWKSARHLILEGWRLMRGARLRLLYLSLSFLGLHLLALLSFGIGLLFVQPYQRTAETLFYLHLSATETEG